MNEDTNNIVRVMASRHSAFYTPLLLSTEPNFMKEIPLECSYQVAENSQNVFEMISKGEIDIAQSAVSGSWNNEFAKDIVHFAQINKMDGFFILKREKSKTMKDFHWSDLIDSEVLADHSKQPLAMFKYACYKKDIDSNKIKLKDAGNPEEMIDAFRDGTGDFIHLQGPAAQQLAFDGTGVIVASTGRAIGPVAFSSLICTKSFLKTDRFETFLTKFNAGKIYAQNEKPEVIAEIIMEFFPQGIELEALINTIKEYQSLHCWDKEIKISENHYSRALEVFKNDGLEGIFPYSENVVKI